MFFNIVFILLGFILLVWSADKFISGASIAAKHLGMPPLLVGLTMVALGTSFPELMVSAVSVFAGTPELAIGNAIGSNITNIGLVIGLTAIICPLTVSSRLLKREFPLLFLVMAVLGVMMYFRQLYRWEGALLLLGLVLYIYWLVREGMKANSGEPLTQEYKESLATLKYTKPQAWFWFAFGGIMLVVSARIIVYSAVNLAQMWGVSDVVIGLTIVAIGTSLPELMASLVGALKNEHDIAIGNVIGSNLFNILGVLGLPILISPTYLEKEIFTRDYAIMLILTVALFLTAYGFRGPGRIKRWEGSLLLFFYIVYLAILYITH